jgi:hypothetical protein
MMNRPELLWLLFLLGVCLPAGWLVERREQRELAECQRRIAGIALQLELYDPDGPYPQDFSWLSKTSQPLSCPSGHAYALGLSQHNRIFTIACSQGHIGQPGPAYSNRPR